MSLLCQVFRSSRQQEMYLYVDKSRGLQDVPDAGGGTMVNVEGRFQSILKVPDGADQAIHQHDPKDLSH